MDKAYGSYYMEKNRYMKIDKMDRDRDNRGSFWKKIIVFFTYLLCLSVHTFVCLLKASYNYHIGLTDILTDGQSNLR